MPPENIVEATFTRRLPEALKEGASNVKRVCG